MADQDQDKIYKDIGEHMSNAYQDWLDKQSSSPSVNLSPQDVSSSGPVPGSPQAQPQQPMQSQQVPAIPQTTSAPLPPLSGPAADVANASKELGQGIQDVNDKAFSNPSTGPKGFYAQLVDDAQQRTQANEAADMELQKAYQSNQIKPMSIFQDGKTGQNVLTGLALIFGGIGAGLTKGPNMALETINNAINKDMEAQKLNKDNQYNAWRMHHDMTKDATAADMATKRDMLLAVNQQIEGMKAKLIGPQAALQAQQAQQGLMEQADQLRKSQAMWEATQAALKNPSQDPASQIRLKQITGQIAPQEAEAAYKDLDRTTNLQKQHDVILDSFDKANQENTIAGRIAHAGFSPASVSALKDQIMPYLKDAEGRISEIEVKRMDELIPSPGDSSDKVKEKRAALENFMQEKMSSSHLQGLGINPKSNEQTQIRVMNGQQYKKVQGGWIPVQ